jgi:hypothetical protein
MLFWLTLARFRRNFVRKQIDSIAGADVFLSGTIEMGVVLP